MLVKPYTHKLQHCKSEDNLANCFNYTLMNCVFLVNTHVKYTLKGSYNNFMLICYGNICQVIFLLYFTLFFKFNLY